MLVFLPVPLVALVVARLLVTVTEVLVEVHLATVAMGAVLAVLVALVLVLAHLQEVSLGDPELWVIQTHTEIHQRQTLLESINS